jgi:hypothetical protein
VLVTCQAETCEFQRVSTLVIAGKSAVRALATKADTISQGTLKGSRELKLERVGGLVRDAASSAFYSLDANLDRGEIVVPTSTRAQTPTTHASAWSVPFEWRQSANAKTGTAVAPENFAYLLAPGDADEAIVRLLRRLADDPNFDPRREALIRGGVQFAEKSVALRRWRDSLVVTIGDRLKRFESQEGDPATLVAALRDATSLRDIYLQVGAQNESQKEHAELLARVASADDLFKRRLAIADAFRDAEYWDEFLTKSQQLGLVKWSLPGGLDHERQARTQTATLHHRRALGFIDAQQLERAFDEAELAAAHSCETAAIDQFYRTRVELVNQMKIAAAAEYSGPRKALLEQIVRELDVLDVNKERLMLDRIREGESLDPGYLPLQLKKAEFLNKLGRYSEALDVVKRIERNIRLDQRQLDEYLGLDGRINNNLRDTLQKSQQDVSKAFEANQYQVALDAAGRGLKADPSSSFLLYHSALAAAFLRQQDSAVAFLRRYLNGSNLACAPTDEPAKALDLYRLLLAKAPSAQTSGTIPNWVSGIRYEAENAPYDPVSMSFLQPIERITTNDGVMTLFEHEDRSFLVRAIETSARRNPKELSSGQVVWAVEPRYDRSTLSMVEVRPRASSAAERPATSLTYLTSPGIAPDLVLRFAGKQIARGWAGNPFFHPFIWNGTYVFDLTYDKLGRLATATPVQENAGSRPDPFSEPLEFSWEGNSNHLRSIRGTRSGYLRELIYKNGRLVSEKVSYPKGKGAIEYQYDGKSGFITSAKSSDNFFDKKERAVLFQPLIGR